MTLLEEVDELYEQAVMRPDGLTDQARADWTESVADGYATDKASARHLRRCVNASTKLATFWSDRTSHDPRSDTWQSRVDVALGARAWRPQLELALHLLDVAPDEATFTATADLFRIVHNEPFLDGASFDEWTQARRD